MSLKFDDPIRNILRIGRNIRLYYDRELQRYNIGWSQQFILQYIYSHPGIAAQELSEIFLAKKSTISKGIKKLCSEGYVRIEEDKKDRRSKKLYPTPAAEKVVDHIGRLQEDLNTEISKTISACEKEQMEGVLIKLCDISEKTGKAGQYAE